VISSLGKPKRAVAAARIASIRFLAPSMTAEPPTTMEREAKVPKPSRR
jgi:hypothetical protein